MYLNNVVYISYSIPLSSFPVDLEGVELQNIIIVNFRDVNSNILMIIDIIKIHIVLEMM